MLLSEAWAPGRVCLLGEHTDWALVPSPRACLVAPLAVGVRVTAQAAPGLSVHSPFGEAQPDLSAPPRPQDPLGLVHATLRVMDRRRTLPPLRFTLTADLPAGRGFSSSAATAVALVRAISSLNHESLSPAEIAALALEAERDELGVNCGGMDPLACAWACPLSLRWEAPGVQTPLPGVELPLLAAAFPSPTRAAPLLACLGEAVRAAHGPTLSALRVWGEAALRGAQALSAGDLGALGQAMNEAQDAYEALDLAPLYAPGLRDLCAALRQIGALGAKFSGAGGDRSVVALFADSAGAARGAALARGRGLLVVQPQGP